MFLKGEKKDCSSLFFFFEWPLVILFCSSFPLGLQVPEAGI